MNRSLRSQEMQMQAAALKQRQQLRASMMKEKDEELSLFLEMRKREKEQGILLLNNSEEFDAPLGSRPGTSPIFNISSSNAATRKIGADDFLNSDNDKNDYDWLLTPPGTPLFPSLEMESQKSVMSQIGTPKVCATALESREDLILIWAISLLGGRTSSHQVSMENEFLVGIIKNHIVKFP
ncbi:hypothetical protein WN944_017996 [Citrus x changshan-huyou]|uniref:Uncharacterized protein n=1 Tax=Citrus x changshan-huyou TaxID=2935761 RepID=A0AAP0LSJ3_9ROSI